MKYITVFILSTVVSLNALSQTIYTNKDGAIQGYDPVAYFEQGKPVKGKQSFKFKWMGADWFFASIKNQELFESSPEKYAPQYRGYCAYGVAKGGLFKIDPEAWKIVEGKLYLNYSPKIQRDWLVDIPGFIDKANDNWPELKKN